MKSSAHVKVPGSTSNLGSGFDTLGLAVNLHTHVRLERVVSAGIELDGGHSELSKVTGEAAGLFFRMAEAKPFGLRLRISGNVPIARGLGYSATVRVGILAGLNELSRAGLTREQLINLATQLEHHPDNSSPSILGGFTVSGLINGEVRCLAFRVASKLKLVTLVPDFPIGTERARKLMPAFYSKADAVHALNRAALITAAFAGGRLEALKGVFDDRIHQPYRQSLVPALPEVIAAGEKAGALGGFLSGSGSAIICLAVNKPERIGQAMQRVMPHSEVMVLRVDNRGYTFA